MLTHPLRTSHYAAHRPPLVAANGVVATSHPLAAQAGLAMLQAGGNAIDAALATAIALTLLEPTSNGLGGDAFALVWDGTRLHGLNGSGRAPAALTPAAVRAAGYAHVPQSGWPAVTVPGAAAAWGDLHTRFGTLPWARLFEPALAYAQQGYAVTPTVARHWATGVAAARTQNGPEFAGFLPTFAPNGRAPAVGERFVSPGHARSFARLARHGAHDFYTGEIAAAIAAFAQATGGLLTADDLAAHISTWVDPISCAYRGYEVWEIPPSGQGVAALLALGMLDGLALHSHARDSAAAYHLQIEAMKLAFADAHRYVADPAYADVPLAGLLSPAYLATRRTLIGDTARLAEPGDPPRGGTVYLCTADRDGRMVSMIQSTFHGFGSGVVVPEWGIALHSRASGFTLEAGHPNLLAPGKRPYHTIIPAFLTHNGQAVGPFGVMGGPMQPQGHTQMMVNTLDYGLDPQSALDAPRWRVDMQMDAQHVYLEPQTPRAVIDGLLARGHTVVIEADPAGFGRGQAIWRLPSGAYLAGGEPRCDSGLVGI